MYAIDCTGSRICLLNDNSELYPVQSLYKLGNISTDVFAPIAIVQLPQLDQDNTADSSHLYVSSSTSHKIIQGVPADNAKL